MNTYEDSDEEDFEATNEIKLGEQLGQGSFGKVYRGIDLSTGMEVAVKKIPQNFLQGQKFETSIMQQLNHLNIVQMRKMFSWSGYCYIVMELAKGGSLQKLLDQLQLKNLHLTEEQCSQIMKGLISAVEHMHSQNIIHRDLKPENILLSDAGDFSTVKLADFGLSHRFGDTKMIKENCGTCIFMAPEQLLQSHYSKPVDIYSCGIILYMLFSRGKHPTAEPNITREAYEQSFKREWKQLNNMSIMAYDLMKRLTCTNPMERYSASQALMHPWITRRFDDDIPLNQGERIKMFQLKMNIINQFKRVLLIKFILKNAPKRSSITYCHDITRPTSQIENRSFDGKKDFRIRNEYSNPRYQATLSNQSSPSSSLAIQNFSYVRTADKSEVESSTSGSQYGSPKKLQTFTIKPYQILDTHVHTQESSKLSQSQITFPQKQNHGNIMKHNPKSSSMHTTQIYHRKFSPSNQANQIIKKENQPKKYDKQRVSLPPIYQNQSKKKLS